MVRNGGIGWDHRHVAIDDASRLAYTELPPAERNESAVAVLSRALARFTRYGVTVLDRRDGAVLHTMKNNSGVVTQPIVDGALNTAFPIARPVFTVVRHSDIANNANLEHAFVGDDGAVYSATSSAGSFTIEDFGFGSFIDRDSGINGVLINGENYRAGDAESYRTN